jgi:hypothetical protein
MLYILGDILMDPVLKLIFSHENFYMGTNW